MKSYRNIIFVSVIALAILIQLTNPTLAYADGETEPPPPTEEAVALPPTEEVAEPQSPPTAEAVEPLPTTSEPVTDAPTAEPVATETDTATETPPLLEVVQELAPETDIIVLNDTGEVVPLATQEAAVAIVSSDPWWCPGTSAPGSVDCATGSGSKPNFTDPATGLLTWMSTNATPGGTIWIAYDYDSATAEPGGITDITIDGGSLAGIAGGFLTIQGGWDGTPNGSGTITTTPSLFSGDSFSVINWTGAVTVNNITIDGAAGAGLHISTTGDINASNITATNNTSTGAVLDNCIMQYWIGSGCLGSGDVALTGKNEFSSNKSDGLLVSSNGVVTLNNITARDNAGYGTRASNGEYMSTGIGPITLNGTNVFNGNGGDGLNLVSRGSITAENITANNNASDYGAFLYISGGTGNVTLTGSNIFNDNAGTGLGIYSTGGIILENITANRNGYGILVDNSGGTGNVTLNGVTASGNQHCNIFINGKCHDASDSSVIPVTTMSPDQRQVEFALDCLHQQLYPVNLPNGDMVQIVCPVSGKARITRLDNTTLPTDLPAGYTYASAFSLEIFQGGESIPFISEGGYINISFQIPFLQEGDTYSALYFDNGKWVPLKDFMLDENGNPRSFPLYADDPRVILSGVNFVSMGNSQHAKVSTNFPGIFVLAQH